MCALKKFTLLCVKPRWHPHSALNNSDSCFYMKIIRSSHFILCLQIVPTYSWRIKFFSIFNLIYQNLQTYLFTTFSPAFWGQEMLPFCCYGTWWSPGLTSLMPSHSNYHPVFNDSEYNLFTIPSLSQISCRLPTRWFGSCTPHVKWWVMIRTHQEKYFPSRVIQGWILAVIFWLLICQQIPRREDLMVQRHHDTERTANTAGLWSIPHLFPSSQCFYRLYQGFH